MNNNSEKRERFKKLAELRTNEVLKRIKILGNCSNRSTYDYNEEDIKKIFSAIDGKLRDVKAKFYYPKTSSSNKFKL
jgi:hypothetical protein